MSSRLLEIAIGNSSSLNPFEAINETFSPLDNIADLPSREEYDLLRGLGAVFWPPLLDDLHKKPEAWESLSLVCS